MAESLLCNEARERLNIASEGSADTVESMLQAIVSVMESKTGIGVLLLDTRGDGQASVAIFGDSFLAEPMLVSAAAAIQSMSTNEQRVLN